MDEWCKGGRRRGSLWMAGVAEEEEGEEGDGGWCRGRGRRTRWRGGVMEEKEDGWDGGIMWKSVEEGEKERDRRVV